MITDITKQKQYQKKLKETADIDDLTGLYNRHRFHRDLESSLNDTKRGNGNGTLIFIDLDDFNALNDGLGHILADKFLKKIAWSIQQLVKKDAQCYRIGGDQFAVIIPFSDFEQSKKMALMINNRFEKPFSLDENEYYCTAGMGVVNFPQDGKTEDELISRADFALHQAKSKGKNQIDIYTDIEVKMPPDRLNVEKALREAVADDCREFLVYYQPVVDISDGEARCCGAEALVRWNSHKLGFSMSAIIIGIILGGMAEQNFVGSLIMSDGNFNIFYTRPLCLFFLVAAVLSLLSPVLVCRRLPGKSCPSLGIRQRVRACRESRVMASLPGVSAVYAPHVPVARLYSLCSSCAWFCRLLCLACCFPLWLCCLFPSWRKRSSSSSCPYTVLYVSPQLAGLPTR